MKTSVSFETRIVKWQNQILNNYTVSANGQVFYKSIPVKTFKINGRNYVMIEINETMMAKRVDYIVAYSFHGYYEDSVRLIHINNIITDDSANNLMWYRKCDIMKEYIDKAIIESDGSIIEEWRPLKLKYNSKLKYEINNFGIIRNENGERVKTYDNHQYKVFYYLDEGIGKQTRVQLVHRAVAETFIPNPNNYSIVNHIDGNTHNNIVSNLEWVQFDQNIEHSYLQNLNRGMTYSKEQIHSVCEMLANRKIPHIQIACMTGVDCKTVSDIYTGRRWKEISSQYVFQPKKWTPEKKAKIKELILQNFVINEICKIMDIPYDQSSISFYERMRRELKSAGKLK